MKDLNISKSRKVCREYLKARAKFLDYANSSHELDGNDNLIGRIGEFIAFQYFIESKPIVVEHKANRGYDIICDDGIKVSIKTITHESESTRTTRIKEPWNELFVVELGKNACIVILGHITKSEFIRARKEKSYSGVPYCKVTMLNNRGIIGLYGTVIYENDLPANVFL